MNGKKLYNLDGHILLFHILPFQDFPVKFLKIQFVQLYDVPINSGLFRNLSNSIYNINVI